MATAFLVREWRAEERTSIEQRLTDQAHLIAELLAQLPETTTGADTATTPASASATCPAIRLPRLMYRTALSKVC